MVLAYPDVTHSRYSIEKRACLNNPMSLQVKMVQNILTRRIFINEYQSSSFAIFTEISRGNIVKGLIDVI